jgi:hypothetical protein
LRMKWALLPLLMMLQQGLRNTSLINYVIQRFMVSTVYLRN